jgi:hypothetical protein
VNHCREEGGVILESSDQKTQRFSSLNRSPAVVS